MPGATRSARRSGNDESPPSDNADAFRNTPKSASASTPYPTELSREVGGFRPRPSAPIAAPAPIAPGLGTPRNTDARGAPSRPGRRPAGWVGPGRTASPVAV